MKYKEEIREKFFFCFFLCLLTISVHDIVSLICVHFYAASSEGPATEMMLIQ